MIAGWMHLAGMTQHHVGNAGEHPEAEVHAVDQTFAVDQFLQQQVVIAAGIELGHMQDSIPMFEMIMQITGDQQPTGVREFMHGSVSTRSGAEHPRRRETDLRPRPHSADRLHRTAHDASASGEAGRARRGATMAEEPPFTPSVRIIPIVLMRSHALAAMVGEYSMPIDRRPSTGHGACRTGTGERIKHQIAFIGAGADDSLEIDLGNLVLVIVSSFLVVALDAAPILAVPDIHGHTHALVVLLGHGAGITVDAGTIGQFKHFIRVPGPSGRILAEVQRMHLAGDERGLSTLTETEVPDAPVDHGHPA